MTEEGTQRQSFLFVLWAGGGNVGPFLCLAALLRNAGQTVNTVATVGLGSRLAEAGLNVLDAPSDWLPGADDVLAAVEAHPPDVIVVDYMLTGALCRTAFAVEPSNRLTPGLAWEPTTMASTPRSTASSWILSAARPSVIS